MANLYGSDASVSRGKYISFVVPFVHEKSYLRPATVPRTNTHQSSVELRIIRTASGGVIAADKVSTHLETAEQLLGDID